MASRWPRCTPAWTSRSSFRPMRQRGSGSVGAGDPTPVRRAWQPRSAHLTAIKTVLFLACLLPFANLAWGVATDALGANPVEAVTRRWVVDAVPALRDARREPARRLTNLHWFLVLSTKMEKELSIDSVVSITFYYGSHWQAILYKSPNCNTNIDH